MTPQSAKVEALLRELVSSFIDYPHALDIGCFEAGGRPRVDWVVQPHSEDRPKLVGKEGSHARALNFMVVGVGLVNAFDYSLKVIVGKAPLEEKRPKPNPDQPFDPEPACTLLRKWIAAFEIPALVEVKPHESKVLLVPGFTFTITVTNDAYYQAMTLPIWHDATEQSLINSLGVLWRAIGKFNGVRFDVRAARL